ncbi:leucyl aminopeptidase [Prauserella rugosa]|uniref:2,5-dihydroxypyridine 5,6-dioxygenase n=1 Tax=Prauserella rugosa TaxID=43354 RepID=A0A660CAP1_9PSEU|nr:leucyl aminopeptidase [Prauserella rugosa]KMS66375.1 leucyl aminopeptidase [Streptomyces regensis]TWH18823.1 2,5-dihydroxypyridine 5,6-dioxygenase [Prauserella rugosa]
MDQNLFNDICLQQLTLSGVHEGETVVVLTRGAERAEYADAFLWAAQRLGAATFHMRLPSPDSASGAWAVGQSGLDRIPRAVEALSAADMVVDCTFLLFSKEQFEIQGAGTRILTAVEPPELLARLMPTRELRERVEVGEELLAKAQTMRITSPHGTDVTYRLGVYPTMSEYGFTDTPGRWDHWPAAFVFTGGADDGVDGRIVLAPGDVLLPFNTYVQTPVEITIEKGFIRDIRGGAGSSGLDADLLRSYIESFEDPRGYGMSHVGWGLDERAHWHGLTQFPGGMGMELRSFYGNVMFSIGPNNELGGPNDTPCHFDIPMRGNSLYLDDELIVDAGELTVPEMRPADKR